MVRKSFSKGYQIYEGAYFLDSKDQSEIWNSQFRDIWRCHDERFEKQTISIAQTSHKKIHKKWNKKNTELREKF